MKSVLLRTTLAASVALLLGGLATTAIAGEARPAVDVGISNAAQTTTVTLVLKLRNEAALEDYIRRTTTQGDPLFHQFLTTDQFADRFGATAADIARVEKYLKQQGITTAEVLPNHLAIKATGTISQFNAAFNTTVHEFRTAEGKSFHRPVAQPQISAAIADVVIVANGLDTEPKFRPHHVRTDTFGTAKLPLTRSAPAVAKGNVIATGQPGEYTVGDVANFYNINPLYNAGINGKGSTVGIVTLADFVPDDAYAYWSLISLPVKPNRITQIHVDGGGPLSGPDGSGETSLDVEQSGGLAPWANIRVYDAPNTNQAFIDAFYRAVSDNIADSISTSWGQPEIDFYPQRNGGIDLRGQMVAFHQIFMEAAVQGISVFAASGDSGAYDTVRELGFTLYNTPLTVDHPAADSFMTAAGGTTTPFSFSAGSGPIETISQESVWGWDYILTYFNAYVPAPAGGWKQFIFSTGGGGGVSVVWPKPFYQFFTNGIRRTEPNQSLIYYGGGSPQTILSLPSNYPGRNVPDISLNADPFTGYVLVSSTDGGILTGFGGTSFVAPQLNGITALLMQSNHHRIGFWNPQVYGLQTIFGYGPWSAFKDIKAGDNWFYFGIPGYEPGAGIGALNVTNLDLFLHEGF